MDWHSYGVRLENGQYSVKPDEIAWLILLVFGSRKRLVHANHVPKAKEIEKLFENRGGKIWRYFQRHKKDDKVITFKQYEFDSFIDEIFRELKALCYRKID